MTDAERITIALTLLAMVVAATVFVLLLVQNSRHKLKNDLQPVIGSIDDHLEKHADKLAKLEARVAVLEAARRGRGAD